MMHSQVSLYIPGFSMENNYSIIMGDKMNNLVIIQGVLDYRDDRVQKKFPDNWNPNNRGSILYYSAQNDLKFPCIVSTT